MYVLVPTIGGVYNSNLPGDTRTPPTVGEGVQRSPNYRVPVLEESLTQVTEVAGFYRTELVAATAYSPLLCR